MYIPTHLKKATLPHYTCCHNTYINEDTPTNLSSVTANIKYKYRQGYLQRAQFPHQKLIPPIYICLPSQFQQPKQITTNIYTFKHQDSLHFATPPHKMK